MACTMLPKFYNISWISFVLFSLILFSDNALSAPATRYRYPIVVLCSNSTGETSLWNVSCNFRSTRNQNLTACGGHASALNFSVQPAGVYSPLECVSFNTLRNVTALDSDSVLELTSRTGSVISAVVLLAELRVSSRSKAIVFDAYSDFIYTAESSMVIKVLARPTDEILRYKNILVCHLHIYRFFCSFTFSCLCFNFFFFLRMYIFQLRKVITHTIDRHTREHISPH